MPAEILSHLRSGCRFCLDSDVIRQRLGRSGLAGKWDIHLPHVSKLSGAAWLYCNLFPTTVTDEQFYLGVGLQQNAGGRFVYGVWWCDTLKRKTTLEPVKRLAQKLKSEGFEVESGGWLGKQNLDLVPRSKEFVLRMVAGKHILIEEMADLLWTFFESKHTMIEAANRALAKR